MHQEDFNRYQSCRKSYAHVTYLYPKFPQRTQMNYILVVGFFKDSITLRFILFAPWILSLFQQENLVRTKFVVLDQELGCNILHGFPWLCLMCTIFSTLFRKLQFSQEIKKLHAVKKDSNPLYILLSGIMDLSFLFHILTITTSFIS